ncbi:MAG: extracellular solute-binding protein [Dongiaceae bacterium]
MSSLDEPTRAMPAPKPRRRVPEGPYETEDQRKPAGASNRESMRLLDLAERIEAEGEAALALKQGYREMRMVLHLVRSHLSGQLVTSSSLAAASGLSYGTAMRAIEDMLRRGLLLKRPRTATGRSFSLHPSATLLARWQDYARRIRGMVAAGGRPAAEEGRRGRAAAAPPAGVVPLPPVLDEKLALGGSLRVLMHADPTFMAMHALKRHFEMLLGVSIVSRALSIDRLHAEIVENARLAQSKYDLVACDLPWFGEMGENGRLLPLDDLMAELGPDMLDFIPDALAGNRHRGRQYGLPILVQAEVLVYRGDLLAAAGLAPPTRRRRCRRRPRGSTIPAPGSPASPGMAAAAPRSASFLMILAAHGLAGGRPAAHRRGLRCRELRGRGAAPCGSGAADRRLRLLSPTSSSRRPTSCRWLGTTRRSPMPRGGRPWPIRTPCWRRSTSSTRPRRPGGRCRLPAASGGAGRPADRATRRLCPVDPRQHRAGAGQAGAHGAQGVDLLGGRQALSCQRQLGEPALLGQPRPRDPGDDADDRRGRRDDPPGVPPDVAAAADPENAQIVAIVEEITTCSRAPSRRAARSRRRRIGSTR